VAVGLGVAVGAFVAVGAAVSVGVAPVTVADSDGVAAADGLPDGVPVWLAVDELHAATTREKATRKQAAPGARRMV
jgi:hypothetical protein